MPKIKFSIIIATYNAENTIKLTLDSIIGQTYDNYEVLIMDGASNDFTVEKVKSYNNYKIFINSEKDNGIYDAMNKGIIKSSGDYLYFIGSGDVFYDKNVLKNVADEINSKQCDIFCGYSIKTNDGKHLDSIPNIKYTIKFEPICHQSVFAKRNLLITRNFDIDFKIAADQDWLMNMIKLDKKFVYSNIPIVYYNMNGISASDYGSKKFNEEKKIIHKKYYLFRYYLYKIYKLFK